MTTDQSSSWQLYLGILNTLHTVMEEVEDSLSELGLEPKELFLLSMTDEHSEPAQLAKALLLPKPTVTYLIKRLEASGFLKRSSNSADLRRFKLTLTKSGRNAMEKGRALLNAAFDRRLKRLPKNEQVTLASAMKNLQQI